MNFSIVRSEFAESQLDEIYDYYCLEVGQEFASKFVGQLINEPNKLLMTPYLLVKKRSFCKDEKSNIDIWFTKITS